MPLEPRFCEKEPSASTSLLELNKVLSGDLVLVPPAVRSRGSRLLDALGVPDRRNLTVGPAGRHRTAPTPAEPVLPGLHGDSRAGSEVPLEAAWRGAERQR